MATRLRGGAAIVVIFGLMLAGFVTLSLGGQAVASPLAATEGTAGAGLSALYDVAVDVGSATSFTDSSAAHVVWQADRAYNATAGWGYTVPGVQVSSAHAVAGTGDDQLYQTARYWNATTGTYRFDVPTGTYQVDLRFADLWNTSPLQRQFDVQIEGVKYLSNLDIVSAAGAYTAYDWTFVVTVTTSPLQINFIPRASVPIVNGIHVTQLQDYNPPSQAPYPRIGVGVNWAFGRITDYDVASTHLGWYSYWNIAPDPARPNGIEYVQLIDTRGLTPANLNTYYNWAVLSDTIAANLGSTWIIGNEVEASYQGNHTPQQYAQIFKRFYDYIKAHDATALVAIGGVTMVTPARLAWIDAMAAAYQTSYGAPIPGDIWTIHEQIVGGNETQVNLWPVGLPAGAAPGEYHSWVCDQASGPNDFAQFRTHINRMRTWMNDHGFRNKPLWISEYGVLGGDQYNCTQQVIGAFVAQTMQWLNNTTNPTTGLPSDENRIVQRWLWYSMNDQPYNPTTGLGFSGAFFDRASAQYPGALTGVGRAYLQWVNSITPPGPTATPTITPTPTDTPTPTPTRTPLPAGSGALQGQVQLQGRGVAPAAAWAVPLTVSLFLPGDNQPAYQFDAATDASGAFSVPGTATPGVWASSYDVKVKNPQMLQVTAPGLAFSDTTPTAHDFGVLKGGDATGDNRISLPDVSVLASTYNKQSFNSGYDARADFTGDDRVSLPDLSVLASNYNKSGLAAVGRADSVPEPDSVGPAAAPAVSYLVSPASISTSLGQSFNVEFRVNVSTGSADAVNFTLSYNSTYLAVSSVTCAGTPFSTILACTASGGTVAFDGAILAPNPPAVGNQFLMRVTFRALATTTGTPLQYNAGQACLAGACSAGTFSNGTVVITNPPTPTRTPTICPGCPTNTPTATPAPLNLGVNVGGPAYTDSQGQAWVADRAYTPGGWGYQGGNGQVYSTGNAIADTLDDPLYQTERYGMSQYAFDLLPGTYSVTMKFDEIYPSTPLGGRVFSVEAEGYPYISDLDILAAAGSRYKAYDRSFTVTVSDYQLNLRFIAASGAAKVNAIRIVYLGGGPATPTPTQTQIGGPTATATATNIPGTTPTNTPTRTATPTPRDIYEPNNSFDQATLIQPGNDYFPFIDYPDDLDFFMFTVPVTGSYIWAELTNLPADYDLFLYGPDRSLVAWSNYGNTADEYILNYPIGNLRGLYYLRVLGFDRSYDPGLPYRLHVDVRQATLTPTPTRTATATSTPMPLDRNEPNNTFDQATTIAEGIYPAYVDRLDDVDYYKFTVPSAGKMIVAALVQLPADYDLYLADPARNTIAWSRYGGTASEYVFFTAPAAGTYYLWVVGYNHAYDPTDPYRLVLQLR